MADPKKPQDEQKDPWELDPWEQPAAPAAAAGGTTPVPTPPPSLEQSISEKAIPYTQESVAAIGRLMSTLLKLPQQLLTPHETFGATREQEVQMGPGGRLLYNMPADVMQSLMNAEAARQAAAARGEGGAAQTLAYLENSLASPFVKKVEEAGGYAKGETPPPVGQWRPGFRFGPETLGGAIEAVGTVEAPRMATEAVAGVPGRAREFMQSNLGAGERMSEKALAKETGRFEEAQRQATGRNLTAQQKATEEAQQATGKQAIAERTHWEKVAEVERQNQAQQHGFQMRQTLERQIDTNSAALKPELEHVEHNVWQEANRRMNASKPVGNPTSDSANLISKVKDVQTNVLQKIPENVKEFNRILGMGADEELAQLRQDVMTGQGMTGDYEQLPPERKALVDDMVKRWGGQITAGEPLTWEKLQSLKTRLDARLRSGNMNPDLQRAVSQMQDAVVDEMGNLLQQSGGNVQDWQSARDFYREWKEDFHEPTGPQGSGSPVAQALDAVDPARIRKPFSGAVQSTLGNRGVNTLRKYSQWGGDVAANRVEKIIADQRTQAPLPKKYEPKPPPEPAPPPGEPAPFTPEPPPEARGVDIETQRYNVMRDKFAQWRTLSKWEARTFGLLAVPEQVLTWVLDRPSVLKWATKVTEADLKHLDAQPPEVRAATLKVIDNLAAKESAEAGAAAAKRTPWQQVRWYKGPKGLNLDPRLIRRMADVGLVTGSLGAAQGEKSNPQQQLKTALEDRRIELERQRKQKSPGQQIRDLRRIQERYSDNPHMPIGPGR